MILYLRLCSTVEEGVFSMNKVLEETLEYLKHNKLKLNISKTKALVITIKNKQKLIFRCQQH